MLLLVFWLRFGYVLVVIWAASSETATTWATVSRASSKDSTAIAAAFPTFLAAAVAAASTTSTPLSRNRAENQ